MEHSPYPFIYYDLAKAYEAFGDKEKAWEVYDQARYLFPDTKWLDSSPVDSLIQSTPLVVSPHQIHPTIWICHTFFVFS